MIQRRKKPQAKAPWVIASHHWSTLPSGKQIWTANMIQPAKKRTKINPVSKSRAVQLKKYYKRLPSWKKENPICRVEYCAMPTKDCHHKRGRSGKLLLDERFFIPLCRHHHNKVKTDPIWAMAEGVLCQPGEWGSVPKTTSETEAT